MNKWLFKNVLKDDINNFSSVELSIFYFAFFGACLLMAGFMSLCAVVLWDVFWAYVWVGVILAIWFLVSALIETVKVIQYKTMVKK